MANDVSRKILLLIVQVTVQVLVDVLRPVRRALEIQRHCRIEERHWLAAAIRRQRFDHDVNARVSAGRQLKSTVEFDRVANVSIVGKVVREATH